MLHLLDETMKNFSLLIALTILFGADDKAPNQRTRDRDVDIHHIKIDVTVDLEEKSVSGKVQKGNKKPHECGA